MSERYSLDIKNDDDGENVIVFIDSNTDKSLYIGDILERMNKLQAVADLVTAYRGIRLGQIEGSTPEAGRAVDRALNALKPKTTELLLAERLAAADAMVANAKSEYKDRIREVVAYKDAKKAHEDSL